MSAVDWEDKGDRMLQWLRLHFGENGFRLNEADAPSVARRALEAYFDGEVAAIEAIRTLARGTDFQRRVWSALRCETAGDILLSAAPGYEFVDWGGADHVGGGSHGSLHRSDSLGALLWCGIAPDNRAVNL